jgi:ceramide glucosyltransferase
VCNRRTTGIQREYNRTTTELEPTGALPLPAKYHGLAPYGSRLRRYRYNEPRALVRNRGFASRRRLDYDGLDDDDKAQTVIVNLIFGTLALLSLALTLWQWLVARRFPLHQRFPEASRPTPRPALTLLKPLKGCDPATEGCLRSWFTQQYAGSTQILFSVAAADDPVCGIVRKLLHEFPGSDAELVVCGPPRGANAKVSQLVELERRAKHDLVVISDADVRVPPDLLADIASPLAQVSLSHPNRDGSGLKTSHAGRSRIVPSKPLTRPEGTLSPSEGEREGVRGQSFKPEFMEKATGLVCCFYRLANPTTLAMQWEAIAINADFWSQVLQSKSFRPMDFALGAVMATRREHLQQIGGFAALMDCLADDYQLGHRIARLGYSIVLCPIVVECWSVPMGWAAVWKHQLRWARTIRVCQPTPYFFSILSNATLWPLLWLACSPAAPVAASAVFCWLVRILTARNLERRLNQLPLEDRTSPQAPSATAARPPAQTSWLYAWLITVKDLLQAAVWLLAFLGNRIEWRGQRMRLRPDGTLDK